MKLEIVDEPKLETENAKRFTISQHSSGYYQVSQSRYTGGDVISADEYDRVRGMLIAVLDANYGTNFMDIGHGDGLIAAEAAQIQEFWRVYLNEIETKGRK